MSNLKFKKAERTKAKLKLAIAGPSGSGKTMSALRLAKGIGGKIAVIDTENESASLYSDRFEFDTLALAPPYTTQSYIEAMRAAVEAGYDVVIIDSISHQWAGEGGILSRKEQMDSRGGNSFTNWGKLTPEQEKFKSEILHFPIHLIVTMRSKQEYVLTENDKGKQAPRKVGMAPVQREGMEYEFTTVFDVAMNHEAAVSKDRTGIFGDAFFQITEKIGADIAKWLETGVEAPKKEALKPQPYEPPPPSGQIQFPDDLGNFIIPIGKDYKGKKLKDVSRSSIEGFVQWCKNAAEKEGKPLSANAAVLAQAVEKFYAPPAQGPDHETDVPF